MALKRVPQKRAFRIKQRLNTVTNQTLASPTYNGNGVTTAFSTTFSFLDNEDLKSLKQAQQVLKRKRSWILITRSRGRVTPAAER